MPAHADSTVVLGIDAAWTPTQPSGVAAIRQTATGWRTIAVAPSYAAFTGLAAGVAVDWSRRHRGTPPQLEVVLKAAEALAGSVVDVVAVDIPVSLSPIEARRACDTAISVRFGKQGCSTHSPSSTRPGLLGEHFRAQLADLGYPLAVVGAPAGVPRRTIEVYPHPALLRLRACDMRVPYKVARSKRYWPSADRQSRLTRLLAEFRAINSALGNVVGPTEIPIPDAAAVKSLAALKAYEDGLDAVVCAWVGAEYVATRAEPFGDTTAAIWVPL